MLKIDQYMVKWVARKREQMATKPLLAHGDLDLPVYTTIHHASDAANDYGIRKSHVLLQATLRYVRVYHEIHGMSEHGNPANLTYNVERTKSTFFKARGRTFKKVTDVARASKDKNGIFVADYSLLQNMFRYSVSKYADLYETRNVMDTIWRNANKFGAHRTQFITFKIPKVLPDFNRMRVLSEAKDGLIVSEVSKPITWNLIDLWRRLNEFDLPVSQEVAENTILVFHSEVKMAQVRLSDLFEWMADSEAQTLKSFYAMLVKVHATRAVTEVATEEEDDDDTVTVDKDLDYEGGSQIYSKALEMVEAGKMSAAQAVRFKKMGTSYKTIESFSGNGTLEEDLDTDVASMAMGSDIPIMNKKPFILDDSMHYSSIDVMDKVYRENYLHKHVSQMVVGLQTAGAVVKDIKKQVHVDAMNRIERYTVKIVPVVGKESTLHFQLPVVDEDGAFYVSGIKRRLDPQRVDLPIRKAGSDKVALTSYAGKAFVIRSPNANANVSRWITKLIANDAMSGPGKKITNLVMNNSQLSQAKTPRLYSAVGMGVGSFTANGVDFSFLYDEREAVYGKIGKIERDGLVVCGKRKSDGALVTMDEGGYLNIGATKLGMLPQFINSDWPTPPVEYAMLQTYGKKVPLALALASKMGLRKLLRLIKAKSRWLDPGVRLDLQPGEFRITFKDSSLIVDGSDPKVRLIMGGFTAVNRVTKLYRAKEFNKPGIYGTVLEDLKIGRHVLAEITLMYDMFVDPITRDILREMKEPEVFQDLLLRSAELLMDDQWVDEMDTRFMRSRGYERFAGFVYKRLMDAVREQRKNPQAANSVISMPHQAVMSDIISDESVVQVEESNPIHALKEREAITFSGQGGRSAQTMVQKSRVFHANDVGFISESGPDSAKVGIRSHRVPNAKYNSIFGTTDRFDYDKDGVSSAFSSAALISPGASHNDPKRIALGDIQWSSMVSATGAIIVPLRTGYEMVIADRVGDLFAVSAREDGVVSAVEKDAVMVRYKSIAQFVPGDVYKSGDVVLDCNVIRGEKYGKQATFMQTDKITKLPKVSSKELIGVKPQHAAIVIATDDGYTVISNAAVVALAKQEKRSVFPVFILAPATIKRLNGKRAKSAKDVFDAEALAGVEIGYELGVRHGKAAGAIIPHSKVTNLKKGDKFVKGDILAWNENYFARDYLNPGGVTLKMGVLERTLLIETKETYEDSSAISRDLGHALRTPTAKEKTIFVNFDQVIHNLLPIGSDVEPSTILCAIEESATADVLDDEEGLSGLTRLAASVPKAGFKGKIMSIDMTYMGDIADMSPSLAGIVKADAKARRRKRSVLKDSSIAQTAEIKESVFFGGQRVTENTLSIVITMDVENIAESGDKIVFDASLKSIISEMIEGSDHTEDGQPIHARTSYRGVAARTVLSPELSGPTNTALLEITKLAADVYFKGSK